MTIPTYFPTLGMNVDAIYISLNGIVRKAMIITNV